MVELRSPLPPCRARRLRLLSSALVLSTLAGPSMAQDAPAPGPRIEFEVEQIDLGRIDRGSVVTAQFKLRNSGTSDLRIESVKPG
ncbi:MAG TPA: DUF1573 domain-containing protein [Candidatus Polarisedimenticolaceae bacterium]|nr:DUF1573 domain-containing protein [Candidatus Polarisedimenticolaceae bacterium]